MAFLLDIYYYPKLLANVYNFAVVLGLLARHSIFAPTVLNPPPDEQNVQNEGYVVVYVPLKSKNFLILYEFHIFQYSFY